MLYNYSIFVMWKKKLDLLNAVWLLEVLYDETRVFFKVNQWTNDDLLIQTGMKAYIKKCLQVHKPIGIFMYFFVILTDQTGAFFPSASKKPGMMMLKLKFNDNFDDGLDALQIFKLLLSMKHTDRMRETLNIRNKLYKNVLFIKIHWFIDYKKKHSLLRLCPLLKI